MTSSEPAASLANSTAAQETPPGDGSRPHPGRAGADAWDEFWDQVTSTQRILREDADEYVQNLCSVERIDRTTRVLDFGCGFGFVARLLAPVTGELWVWDDAPRMRRSTAQEVAGIGEVRFLDLTDGSGSQTDLRFDLILANSVVQFMRAEEFEGWLRVWRRLLAPGGRIVVSDLVPPDYPAFAELFTLLRFSAQRGFLSRAVYDAVRVMPLYWKTRQARPLLTTSPDELIRWGSGADLRVRFIPRNLTRFDRRITSVFEAQDAGSR
jgi:SAM-dependent methyltransferase